MSISQLYDTLRLRMKQLRPYERATRLRNMVWMMIGILRSKSVHLSKVATEIPGRADTISIARRLNRFLDNAAIQVRDWYAPIARQWLGYAARTSGQIRLIIDGTKIGRHHQMLMVALAWHKRAIPIAWTWISSVKGHSGIQKQKALLSHVFRLLPAKTVVFLVGDTEFETVELMRQLEVWGWGYVLRQRASTQVCSGGIWRSCGDLLTQVGQSLWLEEALLTCKYAYATHLLAYWKVVKSNPGCWPPTCLPFG